MVTPPGEQQSTYRTDGVGIGPISGRCALLGIIGRMLSKSLPVILPVWLLICSALPAASEQTSPGAGPVIVIETVKGTIEFETYPEDAPKTVAHIVALVRRGFYNGLRIHRAEPNFVIQMGDPQSRDMSKKELWGTKDSGKSIGVAEITKKRTHKKGAVGMAHAGNAAAADSQFYITRRATPSLDGRYTVFGQVIAGSDVVDKIQPGDMIKKMSVKGEKKP
jgi:peptidyl-prolyl cis-trans isomerase B (cyclophilin B)